MRGEGMKKIGILTGGGDCPGLNPAIKWVVISAEDKRRAAARGYVLESYGIHDGWAGMVHANIRDGRETTGRISRLTAKHVRTIDRQGGTILGSSRTNPFPSKAKTTDESDVVIQNIKDFGLDAVVAIGGEDTLGVASKLADKGAHIVGIPKTIDKDLGGTEYSLGFESAVQVIADSIDNLRTTAGSHSRTFVVETMGRHAGHLALQGGMAGGAFIILIPEYEFDIEHIVALLRERRSRGIRYSIVVVAEGAKASECGEITLDNKLDAFGHVTLGGIGEWISKQLNQQYGFDTRHVVLSHLQRGGKPCAFDRRMGKQFGHAAIQLVEQEQWGQMVSWKNGRITRVPLHDAVKQWELVDLDREYDTDRYNGTLEVL